MEAFHHIADVTFHNVEYSLSINADENHILIEAEQKDDGSRWSSDFSCRCALTELSFAPSRPAASTYISMCFVFLFLFYGRH